MIGSRQDAVAAVEASDRKLELGEEVFVDIEGKIVELGERVGAGSRPTPEVAGYLVSMDDLGLYARPSDVGNE